MPSGKSGLASGSWMTADEAVDPVVTLMRFVGGSSGSSTASGTSSAKISSSSDDAIDDSGESSAGECSLVIMADCFAYVLWFCQGVCRFQQGAYTKEGEMW